MTQNKRPTLIGRVLRGIGAGILDGLPIVGQVRAVVRKVQIQEAQGSEPKEVVDPVEAPEGLARFLASAGAMLGAVYALLRGIQGELDCDVLGAALKALFP